MDGEARDEQGLAAPPAENSGDGLGRLAARAYRPTRIELDEALRHGWLEMWYQPKIDLRNNGLAGAEALARIRHPELGILLPKSFLPAVWDTGLAHLTEHALQAALRDWSTLDAAGFNLHFSINIPTDALVHLPIAGRVADLRPKAVHWPGLILELTQDQVVGDFNIAQRSAKELSSANVSLSIDDFGTRHLWFSQSPEWAFAEVKIDTGFVKNCAVDTAHAEVCCRSIDLAHRRGSAVVAKGIESGADLEALRRMGCDFGQGVFIAPPMPMQGLLDLLHRSPVIGSASVSPADAKPRQTPSGIDRVA